MKIIIIRLDLTDDEGEPIAKVARDDHGAVLYFSTEKAAENHADAHGIDDYFLDDLDALDPIEESEEEEEDDDDSNNGQD